MINKLKKELALREVLDSFASYEAGLSIQEIAEKYKLARVVKLASNENPLGISPKVKLVLEQNIQNAFRYPTSNNPKLCEAIAKSLAVSNERIVVANGSDELIDLVFRIMAEPNVHNAVAFEPCFAMYVSQAKLNAVHLKQSSLNEDFSFDFEALLKQIDAQTRLVFVTNPDNPSGYAVKKAQIIKFLQALPSECLLVVDEAYIDFTDDYAEYSMISEIDNYPNLAILRTFSKCYGLAGLRIGFGILPQKLAEAVKKVRLPFSVSILAEEAAQAVLEDRVYYQQSQNLVFEGRDFLMQALTPLGFTVYPSQANFIITKPPQAIVALELYDYLLQKGMIIRKLSSYNLKAYLRISIGTQEENELLIALIHDYLDKK